MRLELAAFAARPEGRAAFSTFFRSLMSPWPSREACQLSMEISETPEHYMVYAELPGLLPLQILATISADGLAISVVAGVPDPIEPGRMGPFLRAQSLEESPPLRAGAKFHAPIDSARAGGTLLNGLLVLTLPKLRPSNGLATTIPIVAIPAGAAARPLEKASP